MFWPTMGQVHIHLKQIVFMNDDFTTAEINTLLNLLIKSIKFIF